MDNKFKLSHTTNPADPNDPNGIHEYYQNIISSMPNNVYWLDKNCVTQGCNENVLKFVGLKRLEDFVGITYEKMGKLANWTDGQAQSFKRDDMEVISTGKSKVNVEEPPFYDENGNVVYYLSTRVPLFDKNREVIGIVGISVDITERKQKEEELRVAKEKAEAANKAKIEFLENMRHDIRTPLTGIIGFAELIKNEVTDPKIKEYAGNLAASGQALTDLLNEVLEVIKVSSGEIPFLKKKFCLQKALTEIIALNTARALHKKIDLSLHYDSNIPYYLVGDSARIHRVVLELVTNALTFTHKGYVRLSAQLAKNTEEDVVIKIVVGDTGIGIPVERQQDIYLKFKRLTPSYEGIYKGYGLGLSIAKQLIDDMGGEIYVESEVGAGSKFTFVVKLKKSLLDEALGSEALIPSFTGNGSIPMTESTTSVPAREKNPSTYKSCVLVVEDQPMAAQVVVSMLSNLDCEVDLATKGKEAVDLAQQNQYDLIFMDVGLPDIDGYETTRRIRLQEIKKPHVPIIALTAHASEDNKKHCIGIGMNAVLTKPLIQEKAEDILNSFIPYRRDRLDSGAAEGFFPDISHYKELKLFDFESIKKQFGSEKIATEVANMFLSGLPQELNEFQEAYTQKNWLLVKELVHRMRGGLSYCGALRLQEACAQLEEAIGEGKSELFEGLYHQLLDDIALTEKAMREELAIL